MVEVENNIPEISIIMPVYNSETFLYLAVESVKRQTMKEWELLLIDDGSSDASGRLCDAYAKEDARIRVFHQENQGITKTRNRGIKEARGEFITFIDNDETFRISNISVNGYDLSEWLWPVILTTIYSES